MNERERLIELMEQATNGSCHVGDVAFIATSDMRTFYCPVSDIKQPPKEQ